MADIEINTENADAVLSQIPCPNCDLRNLYLGTGLVARPVGSFSLAGAQMKFSARDVPAIRCRTEDCNFVKFPKGVSDG